MNKKQLLAVIASLQELIEVKNDEIKQMEETVDALCLSANAAEGDLARFTKASDEAIEMQAADHAEHSVWFINRIDTLEADLAVMNGVKKTVARLTNALKEVRMRVSQGEEKTTILAKIDGTLSATWGQNE